MKNIQFFVFYSIVILIYALVNYYIFRHGFRSLPASMFRTAFIWGFVIISSAFILGRILNAVSQGILSNLLIRIGSFWLAPMFYFLLFVLLIDLFRLILLFIPSWREFFYQPQAREIVFYSVTSIVIILSIAGTWNFSRLAPRVVNIDINKPQSNMETLTIAAASDIHLGHTIGSKRLDKIVKIMNEANPDLIVFAGDFVDEDVNVVISKDMGAPLKKILNPDKVFAITGNHEYIGNAEKAVRYFSGLGVKFIRDSLVNVDSNIVLVGREDRDMARFAGRKRKNAGELTKGVDFSKFVIWLDHQPPRFDEVSQYDVDLSISGHTHHGQLWPINYITRAIYKLSWGLQKVNNTWFYVSCGAGGWGPKLRIGSRPEVVIFRIRNLAVVR